MDLACGHVRYSFFLAERGFQILGVDNNESFIQMARKEGASRKLDVDFDTRDILDFDPNKINQFNLILLLYNSFGFFDPVSASNLMDAIWKYLKPGGLFLFDIRNGDRMIQNGIQYDVTEKGNNLMIDRMAMIKKQKHPPIT